MNNYKPPNEAPGRRFGACITYKPPQTDNNKSFCSMHAFWRNATGSLSPRHCVCLLEAFSCFTFRDQAFQLLTWGIMAVFLMRLSKDGKLKYSASLARAANSLGRQVQNAGSTGNSFQHTATSRPQ
eukprot:1161644-Pelagomonas_calceolata.AAC.4